MLSLCRKSSDERMQREHASNLVRKLKCARKPVEPYYPRSMPSLADVDDCSVSETSTSDFQFADSNFLSTRPPGTTLNTLGNPNGSHPISTTKTPNDKYKTELCKNYELNGHCNWGDNCFFAHGKQELQSKLVSNHFYKTKICKRYHKLGFCPYGLRCQYFHFKDCQIHQELFDSLTKKLTLGLHDPGSRLNSVLERTERVHKRLPLFNGICGRSQAKSVQERFLDGEF